MKTIPIILLLSVLVSCASQPVQPAPTPEPIVTDQVTQQQVDFAYLSELHIRQPFIGQWTVVRTPAWVQYSRSSGDTLNGGPNDTWILQVAQTLNLASNVHVTLAGGAQAKNITWVVAGAVTLGTGSDLEGVVLGQTGIVLQTGAVMHGRALAQTAVTLDASTVTTP